MPDVKTSLALVGIAISSVNFFYYLYTVYWGQTRPHFYTWLIWGLVTGVAYAAQASHGGGDGAWITLLVTFFCFTRAAVALHKGEKKITFGDQVCLGFCLLAIVLWQLTDNPLLSVVIVTAIDVAGFYPTIRKSVNKPEQESLFSFFLFGVVYALSMGALNDYSLINLFYPAVITTTSWGFVIFLIIRKAQMQKAF